MVFFLGALHVEHKHSYKPIEIQTEIVTLSEEDNPFMIGFAQCVE